jgi:uracil-DNA glycosylase
VDRLRRLYLATVGLDEGFWPASRPPAAGGVEAVREGMGECRRCPLCESRRNLVFGAGDPRAAVVFVGEAPGQEEDERGEPFVGAAGKMLTQIIAAMGLDRGQVYICNVLKCRPPGNRNPLPSEVAACSPFLLEQLEAISPRVIVSLGTFATHALLATDARISTLRGRFHDVGGVPLMPTFHPSYLLRNPEAKREVWQDIQKVMGLLGLKDPRSG